MNFTSFSAEKLIQNYISDIVFKNLAFHIFSAANKVVVDSRWPRKHHSGEDDVDGPIDVKEGLGVLLVPGDHHDAGLEDQLTRGLGQGPQAAQHSMSAQQNIMKNRRL